jgi:hypothetical protein
MKITTEIKSISALCGGLLAEKYRNAKTPEDKAGYLKLINDADSLRDWAQDMEKHRYWGRFSRGN